ncbi:hypothetical protein H5410_026990 [Solanum commersonii]|uniref:Uncharacterized protein n=1 Tax=Solanum commersonii TaxID=4109 RepID=A0A9J5YYL2_SOLCO|nr:hypothetical protein H5410_026990 [Solanum commersonii]
MTLNKELLGRQPKSKWANSCTIRQIAERVGEPNIDRLFDQPKGWSSGNFSSQKYHSVNH